ncbi:hypothetical protein NDN08_007159 [Rhodosorus marinus]|uniref:Small ribosomal subunit protein uS7 domain-containing protein n=1 Tax=Rhodosorus marinus TaxID=101924 RepID=A0AAV8UFR8_9RHOD|nr:hypothetical protein NDN08_007159 [Rhodosorus marinus]
MMFSRDPVVLKFIKKISVHNDEVAARKVVQEAFFMLKTKYGVANPVECLRQGLKECSPAVLTKRRVVAGRTLNIPVPCDERQGRKKGLIFLREGFRERRESTAAERLCKELLALQKMEGNSINMRDNLHRLAESNRAFVHFLSRAKSRR